MKIYYIEIQNQIEGTFATFTYQVYFNSLDAQNNFVKKFNANKSSLENIISKGEAAFNKLGILVP